MASIADMACYPWIVPYAGHGQDLGDFPHLRRWFECIRARPATVRAYVGVADVSAHEPQPLADETGLALVGAAAGA